MSNLSNEIDYRIFSINEISNLLLDAKLIISEMSCWLDYMCDSHIRRHFKSEIGMTPSQYRKKSII